jgi:hypothetical protein
VTLGVQHEDDSEVGNPFLLYGPFFAATHTNAGDFTTRGWIESASWQHQILEDLSAYGFVQYGNARPALLAEELGNSVSVELQLTKNFAHGFSVYGRYGGTYFVSGNAGPYGNDSTFTIGAIKRF